MGLDLGTTTLGIAVSDRTNTIATPYKTIRFSHPHFEEIEEEFRSIVMEKQITDFVLGYPVNMNYTSGEAVERTLLFKEWLEKKFSLPIHLVDERLSTVEAQKILISTDMNRKKRKQKIDGLAASLILETFLKKKGNI